jgi:hypothetical protein
MKTIERKTRFVSGCRVTLHRVSYNGDAFTNRFLVRRPIIHRRHWLKDLIVNSNMIHSVGCSGPGQFYAHDPIFRRVGRGRVLITQSCGWDV